MPGAIVFDHRCHCGKNILGFLVATMPYGGQILSAFHANFLTSDKQKILHTLKAVSSWHCLILNLSLSNSEGAAG